MNRRAWILWRARARVGRRRVAEHAFVLFALGPLILGAVAWVSKRYVEGLREPLLEVLGATPDPFGRPALVLGLTLALVLWPGSLASLFGRGDDPIDALPVSEATRLGVAMGEAVVRALLPAVILAAASSVLLEGGFDLGRTLFALPVAWTAAALVAWVDLLLAAVLVHFGAANLGGLLALGTLGAALAAQPLAPARAPLFPFGAGGALVQGVVAGERPWLPALSTTVAVVVTVVVALVVLVPRWRRRDLERARAAETQRGGRRRRLALALLDRAPFASVPASVTAQLRRDLRLVARRFSPAVHLAVGTALVAFALAFTLATDPAYAPAVRRGGLVLGVALAVLATVSIVPFLLKHQLSVLWLERSAGVEPASLCRAKALLAGLLAVPPTALGMVLALAVAPGGPSDRLVAAALVFLAASAVASVVGLAAFEIAEEPLLGLVFAGFVGLALAALYVAYPLAWWLWLAGQIYLASVLAERGPRRVRFTEVER